MSHTLDPSENWDDDFEFSQCNSKNSPKPKDARKTEPPTSSSFEPRQSVASSHFSEDWDADDGSRSKPPLAGGRRAGPTSAITSRLGNWAEPGPSTPTKRGATPAQAENWDDDFEDKADSPPGRRHHALRASHHVFQHHHAHVLRTRHSYHTPPRPKLPAEPENWDDDFDDPTGSISPSKTDNDTTPVTKRTRRDAYPDSSDEDDDIDFGFSEDKEEDKTVTARSRTAPMTRPSSSHSHSHASSRHSPPPPVPALPHSLSPIEPFPRSPTVSVFSIPTTSGRNSIGHFNSTSHLILSGASSLAMLPPSPPTQRERRRLRKKSRPPHLDNNVFELVEEQRDASPPPLPPSTPDRDRASSPSMPMPPSIEATPGGTKTPLLSRIGSVKKWGARRKRASTGPIEIPMQELGTASGGTVDDDAPRSPSALGTPLARNRNLGGTRSTWFFRNGGAHSGAGSPPPAHEHSLEQTQMRPGSRTGADGAQVPTTPSKHAKLSKRKPSGVPLEQASSGELTGDGSSSASGLGKPSLGPGRRPSSMQVPNGAALSAVITGANRFASVGTRHASYGSSIGRASSSRVFSTPTPTESVEQLPPMPALPVSEGSRFMGSVRKISLVGGAKHKKRSSIDIVEPTVTPCDNGDERDADGDVKMQTPPRARTPDLLPPIELHPPSPPRPINGVSSSHAIPLTMSDEPVMTSMSAPVSSFVSAIMPSTSPTSVKATPKSPSSPQSASLGRATPAPSQPHPTASVPRRNSLGDLKIPARISQAQMGLKRDLGMVREFATSVDRLKELQSTYQQLLGQVQTVLETSPSRAASPNVFSLVRPRSRLRSNTSPQPNSSSSVPSFSDHKHLAATYYAITGKYKVSWECAELLIELGGGAPAPTSPSATTPSSSLSAPPASGQELDLRKSRERAITLSLGEESKPGPPTTTAPAPGPSHAQWRASTGRHDLSQRQLVLLRDMLSSDPPEAAEDDVNKHWRWGDAMSSTVTLPSEESDPRGAGEVPQKTRRRGRMGLTGLRDVLRLLKRGHSEQAAALPAGASTASLSTESSHYSHYYAHGQVAQTTTTTATAAADSVRLARDHPSPRRPSIASIFRIVQKHKAGASSSSSAPGASSSQDSRSASRGSDRTEDDWDRIESAVDLDGAAHALGIEGTATIKGRKGTPSSVWPSAPAGIGASSHRPVTPRHGHDVAQFLRAEAEASPRSIRPMRSTRLSNVEEVEDGERCARATETTMKHPGPGPVVLRRVSPHRPPSRGGRTGSVRSTQPAVSVVPEDVQTLADIKLSMTPENIRPLLENAREVHARCHACVREMRALLEGMPGGAHEGP